MDNVNNLNGIPNFGHGFPEVHGESTQSNAGVQEGEATLGVEEGAESEIEETSGGDSIE